MVDEVRADPVELGRAAELTLVESQALFDALRLAWEEVPFDGSAAGGTPTSDAVAAAHGTVTEAAGAVVERLVGMLEKDVDALYQTAFAFQRADEEAAGELMWRHPAMIGT